MNHISTKYRYNDATKLAKLLKDFDNKALVFYGTLHENVHDGYTIVSSKFNASLDPTS